MIYQAANLAMAFRVIESKSELLHVEVLPTEFFSVVRTLSKLELVKALIPQAVLLPIREGGLGLDGKAFREGEGMWNGNDNLITVGEFRLGEFEGVGPPPRGGRDVGILVRRGEGGDCCVGGGGGMEGG